MSYTPATGLPFFSAYNSVFQNESASTYSLEFDSFVNLSNTTSVQVVIPDHAFMWGDCRSVGNSGDTDYRHHFRLEYTQPALTDKTASIEYSGEAGSRNNPASGDMMYGLNKTGGSLTTKLQCVSLYNVYDQIANFNRLVGIFIQ